MGELPLSRWRVLAATDVDLARQRVTELFSDHRLDPIGRITELDARVHSRRLHHTAITAMTYGADVRIQPAEPRPYFALLLPLSGTAVLRLDDVSEVRTTQRMAALVSTTERLDMHWSRDCAQLALRIERTALEAHLAALLDARLPEPLRFTAGMDAARGTGLAVRLALTELVAELDRPSAIVDHPLIWESFEQGIMSALLTLHPHNYTDPLRDQATVSASPRELDPFSASVEGKA